MNLARSRRGPANSKMNAGKLRIRIQTQLTVPVVDKNFFAAVPLKSLGTGTVLLT
jgi:hypothetical protein